MHQTNLFSGIDNTVQGLQQHMQSCHDSFVYTFPEDHPDVVPAINVRCRPLEEFDETDYFGQRTESDEAVTAMVSLSLADS